MPDESTPSTHTHFFRDEPQLVAIVEALIPRGPSVTPARIWSAGCSMGAEPYSIAMLAIERNVSVDIDATDYRDDALGIARSGRYDQHALRHVSPERLARFFDHDGDAFVVKPSVRSRVRFARVDLCESPAASIGPFDAIVCRNVLIYYDHRDAARLVTLLAARLASAGTLFLGASDHFTFRETDIPLRRVPTSSGIGYAHRPARTSTPTPPPPGQPVGAAPPRSAPLSLQIDEAFAAIANHAFDDAERILREAIVLDPTAPEPHYYLGLACRKAGRFRDAVDALRRAALLATNFWPASFLLAGAWERVGRCDRAEQARAHVAALLDAGPLPVAFRAAVNDPLFDVAEVRRACAKSTER